MPNILQDNKGNYSSLRVILIFLAIVMVFLFVLFTIAFFKEMGKEEANYMGLTSLFSAMFGTFILGMFAKVIQKRYE